MDTKGQETGEFEEIETLSLARQLLAFAEKFPGGKLRKLPVETIPDDVLMVFANAAKLAADHPDILDELADVRKETKVCLNNPNLELAQKVLNDNNEYMTSIVRLYRQSFTGGTLKKDLTWEPTPPKKP